LEPDLTILVRVEPEVAAERGGEGDRFEAEGLEFQRAVAAGYEAVAAENPERVVVVDGEGSEGEVHGRVMALVRERQP
jgi:dTMP kinase